MTDVVAPVVVRAGAAAIPDVMRVMTEAFDPAYGEAWTASQCAGLLDMPGSWLVLAHRDGEPAGFALSRAVLDEAELLLIAVRPAWRRRGLGAALLSAVVDEARGRGLALVHLEARDGNAAAALYEAHGFRQVGRRRDYYRGGDGTTRDALTMQLALRPVD